MMNKELRRLRRDDLLQMMINQQRQIDALNGDLQRAQTALANRDVAIAEAGTLAEAAMRLNGVYEAAQGAADEYLAQMRGRADALLAEAEQAKAQAEKQLADAKAEAGRILQAARSEAEVLKREAVNQTPAQAIPEAPAEDESKRRRGFGWRRKS